LSLLTHFNIQVGSTESSSRDPLLTIPVSH
jgi:hypothetical protein